MPISCLLLFGAYALKKYVTVRPVRKVRTPTYQVSVRHGYERLVPQASFRIKGNPRCVVQVNTSHMRRFWASSHTCSNSSACQITTHINLILRSFCVFIVSHNPVTYLHMIDQLPIPETVDMDEPGGDYESEGEGDFEHSQSIDDLLSKRRKLNEDERVQRW